MYATSMSPKVDHLSLTAKKRASDWHEILELTRQMRALSLEQELEQLVVLQQQRQACIEAFFAQPIAAHEAERVAAGIHQMLESDQLIFQQGEKIKQDIGQSLQKSMENRKAVDAYHGISLAR